MRNSSFLTLAMAGTLGLASVGCESHDKVSSVGPDAREAITVAATARYPGNARVTRDMQVAAIDYPEKDLLEIHNLGDQSIPAGSVWVNGAFMTRIDGIAPKSFVTVPHGMLLEAGPGTNDLKALNQAVAKVELQTDRGLYSVQGPSIKRD